MIIKSQKHEKCCGNRRKTFLPQGDEMKFINNILVPSLFVMLPILTRAHNPRNSIKVLRKNGNHMAKTMRYEQPHSIQRKFMCSCSTKLNNVRHFRAFNFATGDFRRKKVSRYQGKWKSFFQLISGFAVDWIRRVEMEGAWIRGCSKRCLLKFVPSKTFLYFICMIARPLPSPFKTVRC